MADKGRTRTSRSRPSLGEPLLYDLWELRERFLKIEKGNEAAVIGFLNGTGFWERQTESLLVEDFWKDQQAIRFLLT